MLWWGLLTDRSSPLFGSTGLKPIHLRPAAGCFLDQCCALTKNLAQRGPEGGENLTAFFRVRVVRLAWFVMKSPIRLLLLCSSFRTT